MIDVSEATNRIRETAASWNLLPLNEQELATPLLYAGLVTLGIAAGSRRLLIAVPAGAAVVAAIRSKARSRDGQEQPHERMVEKAVQHAELGRKLAIYERETGLLAYWFVALRGDEECARSGRYGERLTLLVAEGWPQNSDDVRRAARGFTSALRAVDILSYVGNGRFIAILPNTSIDMLESVERRIQEAGFDRFGAAAFGVDGRTFDALRLGAIARLAPIQDRQAWRDAA